MAIKSKKLTRTPEGELQANPDERVAETAPLELGFVLDKSLSMGALRSELIGAFNNLLAEHAQAPNVKASLSLFSTSVAIVADNLPIQILAKLNHHSYHPEGQTALLDGIGSMIYLMDRANTDSRKLVAIFTDGYENASSKFDLEQIIHEIADKQASGWQFIFITPRRGIEYAVRLGIPREHVVDFDASGEGLRHIMNRLSKTVKAYRIGDEHYAEFLLEDTKA